jgi:hypothetical protein
VTNADECRKIAEGIAALAVSHAEQGASEEESRTVILKKLTELGQANASMVRLAASAVTSLPEPLDEAPEEIEHARAVRELMGVRGADDDLAAMLCARERLERLATDLE